jgi:hypothetical protein
MTNKKTTAKSKKSNIKICGKYEYDESGMGKFYGACCSTCIFNGRKECPNRK